MFSNLKVVELASVLAGPSVGQFFAELGAKVIKVENPDGGDVTRSWKVANETADDRSSYFCSVNWGKKSIICDLKNGEDLKYLYFLVEEADVVIASYKPGDAKKLKVDYESLKKVNPKLIYGKVTGFGENEKRVGYDAIIQAESGFMSMNGETKGDPLKMPVALMDVLAAHQLKEALLLALLNKERTGEGAEVEVSLIEAAIASLMNQATNYLIVGNIPEKLGSAHPNIAPYGEVYYSKDNLPFVLAVGSDRQFQHLCKVLKSDLYKKSVFSNNNARVINRKALKGELNQLFLQWDFKMLEKELLNKHIPYGRIRNIKEVLESPYAQNILLSAESGIKSVRHNAFRLSFFENILPSEPPHYKE